MATGSKVETGDYDPSGQSTSADCWARRSWSEKILAFCVSVMLVTFAIATIVLVEIYFRLENRLANLHHPLITDDSINHSYSSNWTQHGPTSYGQWAKPDGERGQERRSLCLTPICIEAASRILTSIDHTADPCFDMARFACGGWTERTMKTPNHNEIVMVLEDLQSRVDHEIKTFLEGPPDANEVNGDQKVRGYYRTCMAEGQQQERRNSIARLINELGGISHPSEWSDSWDLTSFLANILSINGAPLFDIAVQVDDRNVTHYILSIGLPRQSGILPQFYSSLPKSLIELTQSQRDPLYGDGLSRGKRQLMGMFDKSVDGIHPEDLVDLKKDLLSVMGTALNESSSHINHPSTASESIVPPISHGSFIQSVQRLTRQEKAMAALRVMRDSGLFNSFNPEEFDKEKSALRELIELIDNLTPSERDRKVRQATKQVLNYFTVDELNEQFGFIDWLRYLQQVIGKNISSNEIVMVPYPEVLRGIRDTIGSGLNKRILHNALLVLLVRDLGLELFKPPPGMEKWQFCIGAVKSAFGDLVSAMYIRQFSKDQLDQYKRKAQNMFVALKESIVDTISITPWLDETTRLAAIHKAESVRSNLVTPELFFNRTFLENTVKDVHIENLDFVASTFQLYKIFRRDFHELYSIPVDETTVTWQLLAYPIIANAFYLQHFNSMVVPLALLNDPLFSMETPRYLGLGTLGFIVAHEIMHGFDRTGVDFNAEGSRQLWMSDDSRRQFDQKLDCIANQYSNTFQTLLSYNGNESIIRVDGQLTMNENAADLGAIKAIVDTHRRWTHRHGPDMDLPGLNYTQEQILIIHAAQAYCSVLSPHAYAVILGVDEHAPPTDRVNGFLMNLPEMASIFNCPIGSRLNPKTKCSLW